MILKFDAACYCQSMKRLVNRKEDGDSRVTGGAWEHRHISLTTRQKMPVLSVIPQQLSLKQMREFRLLLVNSFMN